MALFASINKPTTLRQWLRRSLLWTGLCCGLIVGAWYVCDPFLPDGSPAIRLRWSVLLLVHIGTTVLLGRQVKLFGDRNDEAAWHSPWYLKLATQIWAVLLLVLTWIWLLTDFALLLFWLLTAVNRDADQPWF